MPHLEYRTGRIMIGLTLAAVTVDRLFKWSAQNLPPGKVFYFSPGLTFGRFPNPALFFLPAWHFIPWLALLILLTLIALLVYRATTKRLNPGTWPLIPIALGGASNVFDRFVFGGAIDYVNILGFATVNLADILIIVGLILTLLQSYDQRR